MKTRYLNFLLLIGGILSINACSNDFLEPREGKTDGVTEYADTIYIKSSSYGNETFDVFIPEASNSFHSVISYPEWMDSFGYDSPQNGYLTFYFTAAKSTVPKSGQIQFKIEGKGIVKINVVLQKSGEPIANSEEIIPIEGLVTDAKYYKQNNLLLITTLAPNYLIIYNTEQKTSIKIPLVKNPSCVSISENGETAIVGQNTAVSLIDIAKATITKTYELDFNVYDIALGENGWCYLVLSMGNSSSIHNGLFSLNLETSQLKRYEEYTNRVYSDSHLQKIKNKPYLLSCRTSISPNGVTLINISEGEAGEQKYWHESLGDRFWLTEDGEYTIGSASAIFKTPTVNTGSDLFILSYLSTSTYFEKSLWIDHCEKANRFWAIQEHYGAGSRSVQSFDSQSYLKKENLYYSDYVITKNGTEKVYATDPYYVFSNKDGDAVFLIKNIKKAYDFNAWSIEKLKIK